MIRVTGCPGRNLEYLLVATVWRLRDQGVDGRARRRTADPDPVAVERPRWVAVVTKDGQGKVGLNVFPPESSLRRVV